MCDGNKDVKGFGIESWRERIILCPFILHLYPPMHGFTFSSQNTSSNRRKERKSKIKYIWKSFLNWSLTIVTRFQPTSLNALTHTHTKQLRFINFDMCGNRSCTQHSECDTFVYGSHRSHTLLFRWCGLMWVWRGAHFTTWTISDDWTDACAYEDLLIHAMISMWNVLRSFGHKNVVPHKIPDLQSHVHREHKQQQKLFPQ